MAQWCFWEVVYQVVALRSINRTLVTKALEPDRKMRCGRGCTWQIGGPLTTAKRLASRVSNDAWLSFAEGVSPIPSWFCCGFLPLAGPKRPSDAIVPQMLERSGWVPKVPQLVGESVIDEKCGGTKICVVAALPHILDSGKTGRCVSHWVATYVLVVCLLLLFSCFFFFSFLCVVWVSGGGAHVRDTAGCVVF